MAHEAGTVTGHIGLLSALKTFLTTDADLVAASQEWTTKRDTLAAGTTAFGFSSEHNSINSSHLNAFDDDEVSAWDTLQSNTTGWLSVGFATAIAIGYVEIVAGGYYGDMSAQPKDFTIEYSNDGDTWYVASTHTGEVTWTLQETRLFATGLGAGATHRWWRVNVTDNNGSTSHLSLAELKMYEVGDTGQATNLIQAEASLIMEGPGTSGTDEIFIGLKPYDDISADYYNIAINCFTGYVAGNTFDMQPGRRSDNSGVPLWNASIPYIFEADGGHVTVLAKIETVYMSLCLGKYLPYATPGQNPLPLVVSGMLPTDSATRYSDASVEMELISGPHIRDVAGAWQTVEAWPYSQHNGDHLTAPDSDMATNFGVQAWRDIESTYGVVPPILNDANGVYGELAGIYFISGFNNAVENTAVISADTFDVWRNGSDTGFGDYLAVKRT